MEHQTKSSWAADTRKNRHRLMIWTLAWTGSVALATFGPHYLWQSQALTIVSIILNLGLGAGMIVSNKVYLDTLDELQRKIQLEATAVSLGVGLVVGIAYSIMDISNLINQDAEISYLIMIMGFTYIISTIIGRIKYL